MITEESDKEKEFTYFEMLGDHEIEKMYNEKFMTKKDELMDYWLDDIRPC